MGMKLCHEPRVVHTEMLLAAYGTCAVLGRTRTVLMPALVKLRVVHTQVSLNVYGTCVVRGCAHYVAT